MAFWIPLSKFTLTKVLQTTDNRLNANVNQIIFWHHPLSKQNGSTWTIDPIHATCRSLIVALCDLEKAVLRIIWLLMLFLYFIPKEWIDSIVPIVRENCTVASKTCTSFLRVTAVFFVFGWLCGKLEISSNNGTLLLDILITEICCVGGHCTWWRRKCT